MSTESSAQNAGDLMPGWTTFGDLAQSNAYKHTFIPQRLLGNFMNTPWPQHDLGERIIDTCYISPAQPQSVDPQSVIEITHDKKCNIDGEPLRLHTGGMRLRFLNILLLTRGFYIRSDEFLALAGLTANVSKREPQRARQALMQRSQNDALVTKRHLAGPAQKPWHAMQLHPGTIIMEKRDIHYWSDL